MICADYDTATDAMLAAAEAGDLDHLEALARECPSAFYGLYTDIAARDDE